MNVFRPLALLGIVAAFIIGAISVGAAAAQQHQLDLAFDWAEDGSCPDSTHILALTYEFDSDILDARGNVRQAPTGGNCQKQGLAYDVTLRPQFLVGTWAGADWYGTAVLGADRHSHYGEYCHPDTAMACESDAKLARLLSGGSIETVTAALAASADIGFLQVTFGVNMLPVAWSDGEESETFHAGVETGMPLFGGDLEFAVEVDSGIGEGAHFGSARTVWRTEVGAGWGLHAGLYYAWGLAALGSDLAGKSEADGAMYTLRGDGNTADTAMRFSTGVTYRL